jgi:hypothetical protein
VAHLFQAGVVPHLCVRFRARPNFTFGLFDTHGGNREELTTVTGTFNEHRRNRDARMRDEFKHFSGLSAVVVLSHGAGLYRFCDA